MATRLGRGVEDRKTHFLVRIRRWTGTREAGSNKDLVRRRFPYVASVPAAHEMSRQTALLEANAFASNEWATLRHYDKTSVHVVQTHTLRDWLTWWKLEALDLKSRETGEPFREGVMEPRRGAKADRNAINRYTQLLDEDASKHGTSNILDKRIVDLDKSDFNDKSHGLLNLLTGRRPARKDPSLPRPPHGKATPKTKRKCLALFSIVWNHASEHWNIDVPRPWAGIVIKSDQKQARASRAMTLDEYEAVMLAMGDVDPATRSAIEFVRWTACRRSEATRLNWEDIRWPKAGSNALPMAHLKGTKSARGAYRERYIPLVDEAVDALHLMLPKGHRKWPDKGHVFASPRDNLKRMPPDTISQAWRRAMKQAKLPYAEIPHARFHDLRHTRTTEIAIALPVPQAMEITGHSDPKAFMIYNHLAEESGRKLVEADKEAALASKSEAPTKKTAKKSAKKDSVALLDQLKSLPKKDLANVLASLMGK